MKISSAFETGDKSDIIIKGKFPLIAKIGVHLTIEHITGYQILGLLAKLQMVQYPALH